MSDQVAQGGQQGGQQGGDRQVGDRNGGDRGFGGGRGRGRGGRGGRGRGRGGRGGRGRGRGGRGGRGGRYGSEWQPATKLGRLVRAGKIESLEEIYRFSIPIKEYQIVDFLFEKMEKDEGNNQEGEQEKKLKEEVMQVMPVQKQTRAGQRTRFKSFIVIGDEDGHIGLGVKVAKDVQGAIKGAIIDAKLNLIPVRRGYYGNKIGLPHTVPQKLTGQGGSARIRLIPAPRGCGLVAGKAPKQMLKMAGIKDCYTSSMGHTKTRGNFLKATYDALSQLYSYLTPDFWGQANLETHPFVEYADLLMTKKEEKRPERNMRD